MATPKDWDEAQAAAIKILGKKAKIPKIKDEAKLGSNFDKADKNYRTAIAKVQEAIVELEDAYSAAQNTFKQHAARIASSKCDFDLDPDENKEEIAEAKEILNSFFESQLKGIADNIHNLDDLDKHTMSLVDYEAKKCQ